MSAQTTLSIKSKTKDRLLSTGSMWDTFDSLINRLIDEHEAKKKHGESA